MCVNNDITPNQLFMLICFKDKVNPPLINVTAELTVCKLKGLIDDNNKLTTKALTIITDCEAFFKKTKVKVASETLGEDYKEKVKQYREIFPRGTHPTLGYTFRTSIEDITPRFQWFFNRYPEFTWDLVLRATEEFVRKAQANGYRGLGKAGYFIKKTDKDSNTITSPLADMCQDLLDQGDDTQITDFYITYEEKNL